MVYQSWLAAHSCLWWQWWLSSMNALVILDNLLRWNRHHTPIGPRGVLAAAPSMDPGSSLKGNWPFASTPFIFLVDALICKWETKAIIAFIAANCEGTNKRLWFRWGINSRETQMNSGRTCFCTSVLCNKEPANRNIEKCRFRGDESPLSIGCFSAFHETSACLWICCTLKCQKHTDDFFFKVKYFPYIPVPGDFKIFSFLSLKGKVCGGGFRGRREFCRKEKGKRNNSTQNNPEYTLYKTSALTGPESFPEHGNCLARIFCHNLACPSSKTEREAAREKGGNCPIGISGRTRVWWFLIMTDVYHSTAMYTQ